MSSFLRGSPNYVWATTSVLGKGATGAVYQGVNRHTGEPVAVKTFNQLSHMRPREVQVREFEVLKKVKHENIVKLLAIEEEQESRGKVIVMELCTGGSLFNILDDPENTDGLDEHEFLLVLSHLTAGMKHLRDHNLVHRDLKPGNIMKFLNLDGSTVYKLTDFGAARELPDDQQFMSLYGTEEYLHPDMYERAVLRKPVGKKFGASVDLWSIGVTLYHVSTGSLPFRPFGGRRNKETMHFITTKKESGVISGSQKSEDGAIEWSEKLPDSCQLSYGLKKLLTPLLAGLLEVDPHKMWSFELFFQEVTNILACRQLCVFHVNRLHMLKVYMRPDDTYSELGCLLLEQTDISPAQQILLYDNGLLLKTVREETEGRSYPQVTADNPIILLNKDNNNVVLHSDHPLPKFPVMPNAVSVENDAILAKRSCSEGYSSKRQTHRLCQIYRLMDKTVNMFSAVIGSRVEEVKRRAEQGSALTNALAQQVNALSTSYSAFCMVLEQLPATAQLQERRHALHRLIAERQQARSKLVADMGGLAPSVDQLWNRVVRDGVLLSEWRRKELPSPDKLDLCDRKAQSYVNKLRDSWQHLLRDRAARTMTYNDEQFHMLEKIKIQETGKQLLNLLQTECQPAVAHSSEIIADWYKLAQANFVQSVLLEKEMESQEDDLHMFSAVLENVQKDYSDKMALLARDIRLNSDVPSQNGVQKNQLRVFVNQIQKMESLHVDILNFAQENNDLVDELATLFSQMPAAS